MTDLETPEIWPPGKIGKAMEMVTALHWSYTFWGGDPKVELLFLSACYDTSEKALRELKEFLEADEIIISTLKGIKEHKMILVKRVCPSSVGEQKKMRNRLKSDNSNSHFGIRIE